MKTNKPVKKTREALERQIFELQAQLAHVYHFADAELNKAGDCLMGSAVIMHLTVLGGREITKPFAIRDGLSKETIEAIKADLRRSYAQCVEFKPKGV